MSTLLQAEGHCTHLDGHNKKYHQKKWHTHNIIYFLGGGVSLPPPPRIYMYTLRTWKSQQGEHSLLIGSVLSQSFTPLLIFHPTTSGLSRWDIIIIHRRPALAFLPLNHLATVIYFTGFFFYCLLCTCIPVCTCTWPCCYCDPMRRYEKSQLWYVLIWRVDRRCASAMLGYVV